MTAEALTELESAREKLGMMTSYLAFSLGYARMELGQHGEAPETFEQVISAKPDYSLALKYAAHCSFMSDDKTKGIRYAKASRKLGEPGVHDAWRRGTYSRRTQEEIPI